MKKNTFLFIILLAVITYSFGQSTDGSQFTSSEKQRETILKIVSDTMVLNFLDGKTTIANSQEVFKYVDSNFNDWGLNKGGRRTPETKIQVYKLIKDASFKQMFNSISSDLDRLCLTQHQIVEFCVKSQKYLRKNDLAIFFLFKVDSKYYIAKVGAGSSGLGMSVFTFEADAAWFSNYPHRVAVPQLDN